MNLNEVAQELSRRLVRLFLPDQQQRRPYQDLAAAPGSVPDDRDRMLFHEYFHGETGAGLGASHQTGWTSLVAHCLKHTVYRKV
jgi:hypothetical protein